MWFGVGWYCSVPFQSFAWHHLAIASIRSTKTRLGFTRSKFVPHSTPIAHRSQTCIRVSRNTVVVKINCISETIYGLSTLGARDPVPGYRHKMALCSHLQYPICNCVLNNYSSSLNGLLTRSHEGERNNCFSKIQLVAQKYLDKTTLAKRDSAAIVLVFKAGAFRY